MIPEALVVSMLPPEEFGTYLAVGTKKRTQGQAMYFDLKPDFRIDGLDLDSAIKRCVAAPDGQPKHSVYVAVYRMLERIPIEAINSLWIVTRDGRTLQLNPSNELPVTEDKFHLYQELCPVHPLIASTLKPEEFCQFITDPNRPVHVPKICFVEMSLGELANDPENGQTGDLPYPHLRHVRDCLIQLQSTEEKQVKTVDRIQSQECFYRSVRGGFYVGNREKMLFFPMPSQEELDRDHHDWWKSANV